MRIILFIIVSNLIIIYPAFTQEDSIFYFLNQVNTTTPAESFLYKNALNKLRNTPLDSLDILKVEEKIKNLSPGISNEIYLAFTSNLAYKVSRGTDYSKAIEYNKKLIEELKQYKTPFSRSLLYDVLAFNRTPFRNSSYILDGISYYLQMANQHEQIKDSNIVSISYYVLAGFYRTIGLMDKSIYYEKKSLSFLNPNEKILDHFFLNARTERVGIVGVFNRTILTGGFMIENNEVENSLPYLNEGERIYQRVKDSITIVDAPYLYLQLLKASIALSKDSVLYYYRLLEESNVGNSYSNEYKAHGYQELGYYYCLQNILDSSEYYLLKSKAIIDKYKIIPNNFAGKLTPNYFLALLKLKLKKYSEAIELLKSEIDLLLRYNMRKMTILEMGLLAESYKLNNDYINSISIWEKYDKLQKELLTDENNSRTETFETEQKINHLSAEQKKQELEINKQKQIRNWIITGMAGLVLFSILIMRERNKTKKEKKRSDDLLLNILPEEVAEELKQKGSTDAKLFDEVTVMFTDIKDFTLISERMSPEDLVSELHVCFKAFDQIISKYTIEKIKTIGDSYMCVSGLPVANKSHAEDIVLAALEIQYFMTEHIKKQRDTSKEIFEMRIGIHTGPVVAGIVGVKKFAYDIWGDTVNIAARMEQNSVPGKINITGSTYDLIRHKINCIYRGKINAKNKGEIDMYFVDSVL